MRRTQSIPMSRALLFFGLSIAVAALACGPSATVPADEGGAAAPLAPEAPSSGITPYSGEFLEADCSCAGYEASYAMSWGNTGLICRYDWSGPNIDQNALGFEVDHYYHTDQLLPDFNQKATDLSGSLPPQVSGDWQGRELRNDEEGYAFFVYGPGGGGKQGDIPLCGRGRGVFQTAGEFLINTNLDACDLPYSDQAYVSALADMETCARRAIERIK